MASFNFKGKPRLRWMHLPALLLMVLAGARMQAAIEFVQFTDPHVFASKRTNELETNWITLSNCIAEVNRLQESRGAPFSFVALTGDIGLDSLTNGLPQWDVGVQRFRDALAQSKVRTWLMVPGNNDVAGEFPTDIWRYHAFIRALNNKLRETAPDFKVIDLCPAPPADTNASTTFTYSVAGKYHFVGFDDASFKNENKTNQAIEFSPIEIAHTTDLLSELATLTNGFAYVLYHIPDIDDPDQAINKSAPKPDPAERNAIGDEFPNSSWLVLPEIRTNWEQVVRNQRVRGLIAGHFHSDKRYAYTNFLWRTTNYPSIASEKLYVCPPIAIKFQYKPETARGFCTFVAMDSGDLTVTRHWYDNGKFESEPPPKPEPPINPPLIITPPIITPPPSGWFGAAMIILCLFAIVAAALWAAFPLCSEGFIARRKAEILRKAAIAAGLCDQMSSLGVVPQVANIKERLNSIAVALNKIVPGDAASRRRAKAPTDDIFERHLKDARLYITNGYIGVVYHCADIGKNQSLPGKVIDLNARLRQLAQLMGKRLLQLSKVRRRRIAPGWLGVALLAAGILTVVIMHTFPPGHGQTVNPDGWREVVSQAKTIPASGGNESIGDRIADWERQLRAIMQPIPEIISLAGLILTAAASFFALAKKMFR